jgi:ubiquinone biosynthesis monooxygenase Coq7
MAARCVPAGQTLEKPRMTASQGVGDTRRMDLTVVSLRDGETLGDRFLKVNHAGEHGAVHIYAGQILMARLTARAMLPALREFKAHEEGHRAIFWGELQRRGRPRCRSYWPCALGGFALGLMTGLLGRRAIAATTVAVERVVLTHLDAQVACLHGSDEAAVDAIGAIVAEEREHCDAFADELGEGSLWVKLLTPVVAVSTKTVIWLGLRL